MATIKTLTDPKIWENFVINHPESNFLQSFYHGKTHESLGKKVHYLGIFENQVLAGICLAIVENAKRGRYLSIPGGPLLDWDNRSLVDTFSATIRDIAKKEDCVFVRLRPQIVDTPSHRQLMAKHHLRPSPMHLTAEHTLQLDLVGSSEEELLAQMRKTTRYEIRQAEKLGIKVVTESSDQALEAFFQVQLETAKRQKFIPFSKQLILSEFRQFVERKEALLYKAVLDDRPLAYALIIHYPTESSYHFGASTDEGRQLPGAYAIQWQAIRDAKERKIPRYNFWGIVGNDQHNHRFYGVSVFKRGFGGEEVIYIPAYDLVVNHLKYLPINILETFRRKIRKLE